jgi:predicted nucleic acid-binding protein
VELTLAEYVAALHKFAARGIVGGGIYDALIATCALKADVDVIYTWNTAHFIRLGVEVAQKVRMP